MNEVTLICLCCAVVGYIKLALQAGKANPAPPVGPALGSKVILVTPHDDTYMSLVAETNASFWSRRI